MGVEIALSRTRMDTSLTGFWKNSELDFQLTAQFQEVGRLGGFEEQL